MSSVMIRRRFDSFPIGLVLNNRKVESVISGQSADELGVLPGWRVETDLDKCPRENFDVTLSYPICRDLKINLFSSNLSPETSEGAFLEISVPSSRDYTSGLDYCSVSLLKKFISTHFPASPSKNDIFVYHHRNDGKHKNWRNDSGAFFSQCISIVDRDTTAVSENAQELPLKDGFVFFREKRQVPFLTEFFFDIKFSRQYCELLHLLPISSLKRLSFTDPEFVRQAAVSDSDPSVPPYTMKLRSVAPPEQVSSQDMPLRQTTTNQPLSMLRRLANSFKVCRDRARPEFVPISGLIQIAVLLLIFSGDETVFGGNSALLFVSALIYAYHSRLLLWVSMALFPDLYTRERVEWRRKVLRTLVARVKTVCFPNQAILRQIDGLGRLRNLGKFMYGVFASLVPVWQVPVAGRGQNREQNNQRVRAEEM